MSVKKLGATTSGGAGIGPYEELEEADHATSRRGAARELVSPDNALGDLEVGEGAADVAAAVEGRRVDVGAGQAVVEDVDASDLVGGDLRRVHGAGDDLGLLHRAVGDLGCVDPPLAISAAAKSPVPMSTDFTSPLTNVAAEDGLAP